MFSRSTVIKNASGLHARPAAVFVERAKSYGSPVTIGRPDGDTVNAKSIVMLMSASFRAGDSVVISADGPDAEAIVNDLIGLIDSQFGEDESAPKEPE